MKATTAIASVTSVELDGAAYQAPTSHKRYSPSSDAVVRSTRRACRNAHAPTARLSRRACRKLECATASDRL
jgi:hypothetical protein